MVANLPAGPKLSLYCFSPLEYPNAILRNGGNRQVVSVPCHARNFRAFPAIERNSRSGKPRSLVPCLKPNRFNALAPGENSGCMISLYPDHEYRLSRKVFCV
jgi:hypothetical protein